MIYNINTRADWAKFLESYKHVETRLTAVDPDTKECGVASVLLGHPSERPSLQTYTCEAYRLSPHQYFTTLAVVESQRVFPGATQRTKSIVELARCAAGVAGGSLVAGRGDIVFLDPCVWKGQIAKPTKVAQRFEYIVHQRNMKALRRTGTPEDHADVDRYMQALEEAKSKGRDFQFEVMDAVGILLFALEGLGLEI